MCTIKHFWVKIYLFMYMLTCLNYPFICLLGNYSGILKVFFFENFIPSVSTLSVLRFHLKHVVRVVRLFQDWYLISAYEAFKQSVPISLKITKLTCLLFCFCRYWILDTELIWNCFVFMFMQSLNCFI